MIANRTPAGSWERFTMIRDSGGTAGFRAAVAVRYAAAEDRGAAPLLASGTATGTWETFDS